MIELGYTTIVASSIDTQVSIYLSILNVITIVLTRRPIMRYTKPTWLCTGLLAVST